jgi:hypothetical protein
VKISFAWASFEPFQYIPPVKSTLILVSLILWSLALSAQEITALEDSLIALHSKVLGSRSEPERFLANERFLEILDQALALDRKMKYPFDSLRTVSHLMPDDKSFRIFNWFVRHQNGEYTYYGVIQRYSEKSGRYESHWLTDMSDKISRPEDAALDADHWYGAVYYDIIQKGKGDHAYYTLLGWDGNDPVMKRRVVEVLTFRQNGSPVFGYPLFRNYQRKARRMIFEHSARSSMTLRYDNQGYILKERNPKTRKLKAKEVLEDMIVFDRLVPLEPLLEGQREFYVPESNVFDALVWRNGRWELLKDIDARNPPPNRRKEEPSIPVRGLTPR